MSALPTLAYVYDPRSFAPLSITEAAEGLCRFLWIVDGAKPDATVSMRLLRKFGPVIDTSDLDFAGVLTAVGEHDPDAVLSLHDSDLVWTAQLAEALRLPFHSLTTARLLTDKHAQREALARAALAVPSFYVLPHGATWSDVDSISQSSTFPAVLKPRWGQASRDTIPVSSPSHLREVLEESGGLEVEDYVLEGYVPDTDEALGGRDFANFVSVESVVEDGHVEHVAISGRTPFRWPFRETGYFTPCALAPELQTEVLKVATTAAHALGVTIGCLHTEIKLTDDGPVIIEVNGRPGGGISEMLERASGFSILRTALRLAVGDPVRQHGLIECARVGYLLYVFPEQDLDAIDDVEGLSDLRDVNGVDEIILVRGPGQRIDWREGSEAHVFHYTGTTADLSELRQLIDDTSRLVTIRGHDDPA